MRQRLSSLWCPVLALVALACGGTDNDANTAGSGGAGAGGGSGGSGLVGSEGGSWVWQSAIATPAGLNGVWSIGADDVWAVGDGGAVVHWDGALWSVVESGTANHLEGVWGSSANDVWAVAGGVGGEPNLLHWNGSAWSPVQSGTADNLKSVWGSGPNDVWAVGASGVEGVIVHFDGATSSQSFASDLEALAGIWGSGPADVWVVGGLFYPNEAGNEVVLHLSTGSAWTNLSKGAAGQALASVWSAGPSDAWAVGQGAMARWDGDSWSLLTGTTLSGLSAVWGTDADHVTAVGRNATIVEWDGAEWTGLELGGADLVALGGSGESDRWAVGDNGTIFHAGSEKNGAPGCADVGGHCGDASACAPSDGHLSDYACDGGGSQVCCVSKVACGVGELDCCTESGEHTRPICRNGLFSCTDGAVACPMPPNG